MIIHKKFYTETWFSSKRFMRKYNEFEIERFIYEGSVKYLDFSKNDEIYLLKTNDGLTVHRRIGPAEITEYNNLCVFLNKGILDRKNGKAKFYKFLYKPDSQKHYFNNKSYYEENYWNL